MHVKKPGGRQKAQGRGSWVWLLLAIGLALPLGFGCAPSVNGAVKRARPTATPAVPEPANGPTATTDSADTPSKDIESPLAATPARKIPPGHQNRTVDTTFDDLKFDLEKAGHFDRSMLTPQIEQLFGKKIRIRGYIFPTLRKRGLKQFVLVRDNLECCFGPGAALYDCILVTMQPGQTAAYTIRPVAVEGVLRFKEILGPGNKHLAIFSLEGEQVR